MIAEPAPPVGMVMPATAQMLYTVVWGGIAVALLAAALTELVARRRPLFLLLLLGGALCYFIEPLVDVLGLLWHPTIGQWVAVDTFRAVPLWGLFVYVICFGGLPYLMYRDFRRHLSRRRMLIWIGVFWLVDLAVELPILSSGLYVYYGDPPFSVGGLPLYWLPMNVEGPLSTAVVLLAVPGLCQGWRALGVVALPASLDAAGSVVVGWPVFSALHAEAGPVPKYAAALATIAIGLVAIGLTISSTGRTAHAALAAGHLSPG